MFLGGLVGALLVLRADAWLAVAVAAIVLVVVAVAAATQSRTDRPWIRTSRRPDQGSSAAAQAPAEGLRQD